MNDYVFSLALGLALGMIVSGILAAVLVNIFKHRPGVADTYKLIRDQRLYKATHSDFYEYCKDNFGDTRAEADWFVKASTHPDLHMVGTETTLCQLNRSCVYFILGAGLVKIGYSNNPLKRLREIQASSPVVLELLGVIPGDSETEFRIHQILVRYKKRGEWFVASASLLSFIFYVCKYGFVDTPELLDFLDRLRSSPI